MTSWNLRGFGGILVRMCDIRCMLFKTEHGNCRTAVALDIP